MIGDWFAQVGILALAVVVVFGPGLVIGAFLRLRGLVLAAVAPAISTGFLAVLAILYGAVGVHWGLLSVAIATGVVAVLAGVIGRMLRPAPRTRATRSDHLLLIGGLVVGGGLVAARLLTYIGVPWAISQTNDAVFHLNALRWIAETGSASSLHLTGVIGGTSFYPGAWHALVSLVAVESAIPVAVNVVGVVIAAGVWPLGVALLARTATGSRRTAALAAALSGAMLAFPQLMFEWGVLYPYALSLAILPATVAVTILLPGLWQASGEPSQRALIAPALAALAGLVAVALAQPASLLVWGLFVAAWVSWPLLRVVRTRDARTRRRASGVIALVAVWALLGVTWIQLAVLAGPLHWEAYLTPLGALRDVVLNSHGALPPAIGVSVLMIVGLIVAWRTPRLRWLIVVWAGFSFVYVISVGTDLPIVKRALTGAWYGDSYRLAAVIPFIVVPLAAIGLHAILGWFSRIVGAAAGRVTVAAVVAIAAVGAVGVAVAPVILLRVGHTPDTQSRYAMNSDSYLSLDAFQLLRRMQQLVPEDALLIGNPSTGVGFAYALGLRDVVPRTWSPPQSQAWDVIAADLRDAGTEPAVCEALALYGSPEYVLDFGPGEAAPGRYIMPGMTDFDGQPGFELVDREGDASLWRVTACR